MHSVWTHAMCYCPLGGPEWCTRCWDWVTIKTHVQFFCIQVQCQIEEHLQAFLYLSPSLHITLYSPSPSFFLSLQAISNKDQHSISYTLSRVQMVVVEYTHDSNTDMFQVTYLTFFHDESCSFCILMSLWQQSGTTKTLSCVVVQSLVVSLQLYHGQILRFFQTINASLPSGSPTNVLVLRPSICRSEPT